MGTLYDEYDPKNPLKIVHRLCRIREESLSRVVICNGIFPGKDGNVTLYLCDLLTNKLEGDYMPREDLKKLEVVSEKDLTSKETLALENRIRVYARIHEVFSELVKNPNAGKGPEHFCGPWSR